uniref:Uncharacterized protein n=1 Tax=Tanacetum cinerariifolium TaxID=118510 RepID=A0A699H467_TANCI|nr:hypothetical protein [Tanacetum cinerariifolium]
MHKAFPLLVRKFPLPEGTSHCLKKNATARRKVLPLPEVCTAIIVKEKPSIKDSLRKCIFDIKNFLQVLIDALSVSMNFEYEHVALTATQLDCDSYAID